MNTLFSIDCDSGIYTKTIPHIQYEPNFSKVVTPEMTYDIKKYKELRSEIAKADIPDDVRTFLNFAATRHIVFNYHLIADYYATAPKNIQELMEKSGLVIIDFEDAIENGFVDMNETLRLLYDEAIKNHKGKKGKGE